MDILINPNGNFFERIKACWFLFRHPNEFCSGVIESYRQAVVAHMEQSFKQAVAEGERADKGLSMEAAGIRAQEEATNGS
jgi:hypothetical protein